MFQPPPLPRSLEAAVRDSTDRKPAVRRSALRDLSRHADGEARERVLEVLLSVARDDADTGIRAAALMALADADAHEVVPELLAASHDAQPNVRQMALLALGEVAPQGHAETSARLVAALSDSDAPLRFQALLAARSVGVPRWEERLGRAVGDEDEKVRYLALRLIDELAAERGGLPSNLADRARRGLEDPDQLVRVAAALVLADAGSARARAILVEAVNHQIRFPAPEDEQHLIERCGELGLVDATPGLRRAAWGFLGLVPGRFAFQARVALVRLGDATALARLRRELASGRRDVRTLAVVAAGQARCVELRPVVEALVARDAVDSEVGSEALRALAAAPDP